VTKFKCGGWSFGVANQHSLFDGLGAAELMQSWSELARGLPLSNPPAIDRSMLYAREPLKIEYPHNEYAEIEDLSAGRLLLNDVEIVHESFCFTPADTDALKQKVMKEGGLKSCTTFQVSLSSKS
jgi:omega-hydroxypalmitate O-feruloyl transferase